MGQTPLAGGDTDGDGIPDSAESETARDFGGIADSYHADVPSEAKRMPGHKVRTQAKRWAAARFERYGFPVDLFLVSFGMPG